MADPPSSRNVSRTCRLIVFSFPPSRMVKMSIALFAESTGPAVWTWLELTVVDETMREAGVS